MDSVSESLRGLVDLLSIGGNTSAGAMGTDGTVGRAKEEDGASGNDHVEDELLLASTEAALKSSERYAYCHWTFLAEPI